MIIDENGEPKLSRTEPKPPPSPDPVAGDPDFVLGESEEDSAYDPPAFLRKQQAR
jgi:hypothetical protein